MVYKTMSEKNFIGITDELKNKFKALLKEFNVAPQTAPIQPAVAPVAQFGEAKLTDGTVIKWEGDQPLAVGMAVMVIDPVNPEGFLPIPDGSYDLEDGTKFTILNGVISELVPVAAPVVEPMAAPVVTPTFEKEFNEVNEKFNAVTKAKEDLEAKLTADIEAVKNENIALKEQFGKFMEIFSEAINTPTADPIEPVKKVPVTKQEKMLDKLLN